MRYIPNWEGIFFQFFFLYREKLNAAQNCETKTKR